MNKQVIHIFGASGSGTSSVGRYLSNKLGFFLCGTDDYFWEQTDPPFTVKRDISKRLALMREEITTHENALISGSLVDWGDELIPLFTLAVCVETPEKYESKGSEKENTSVSGIESRPAEICTKATEGLLHGPLLTTAAA